MGLSESYQFNIWNKWKERKEKEVGSMILEVRKSMSKRSSTIMKKGYVLTNWICLLQRLLAHLKRNNRFSIPLREFSDHLLIKLPKK